VVTAPVAVSCIGKSTKMQEQQKMEFLQTHLQIPKTFRTQNTKAPVTIS
jgi:hypothetical protein